MASAISALRKRSAFTHLRVLVARTIISAAGGEGGGSIFDMFYIGHGSNLLCEAAAFDNTAARVCAGLSRGGASPFDGSSV